MVPIQFHVIGLNALFKIVSLLHEIVALYDGVLIYNNRLTKGFFDCSTMNGKYSVSPFCNRTN